MLLDNIALFLRIVEKGSLSAAGREAGLSSTTVSERLAALEAHFGVVLLNRTTRAISLTDEGRTLVDGARHVLGEVSDLEARIRHGAGTLSGPIRISVPSDTGRSIVSDVVQDFLLDHPAISIEMHLSDGYVDVVGQGFDIAMRFGPVTDTTLRVRPLASRRRILCAAPSYIATYGAPQSPDDLLRHNCLVMRFGETLDNVWRFGPDHAKQLVTVRGDRIANDGAMVRHWGVAGYGVVLKSEWDISEDLTSGRLVELLPGFAQPEIPFQMLFPPSRAQPKRVKALANRLAARFQAG